MKPIASQLRRRIGAMALLGLWAVAARASGGRRQQMASANEGPGGGARLTSRDLAVLFPASLGPWTQTVLETSVPQPMPGPRASVRAVYTQGAHEAEITAYPGAPTGAAPGTRRVSSEARPSKPDTLVTLLLANGVQFAATSRTADAAALEALLRAIDLDRAEKLQPAAR